MCSNILDVTELIGTNFNISHMCFFQSHVTYIIAVFDDNWHVFLFGKKKKTLLLLGGHFYPKLLAVLNAINPPWITVGIQNRELH